MRRPPVLLASTLLLCIPAVVLWLAPRADAARAAEHVAAEAVPLVDGVLAGVLQKDAVAAVRQRALEGLARRETLDDAAQGLLAWTAQKTSSGSCGRSRSRSWRAPERARSGAARTRRYSWTRRKRSRSTSARTSPLVMSKSISRARQ